MQVSNSESTISGISQNQLPASLLSSETAVTERVGGKSYEASIQQTQGEYVAQVSGLPEITATGLSLGAAELNLGNRIDFLA